LFEKIQNLDYRLKSSIPYEIEFCAVQEKRNIKPLIQTSGMHPIGRVWLNRLLDDFLVFSGLRIQEKRVPGRNEGFVHG
jgi:hypothetical protein